MNTTQTDNELCGGCGCHFETEEHAQDCVNRVTGARNAERIFDYSGLKKTIAGLKFKAVSTNGDFEITSYIATRNGRKVYGYYNYQTGNYIESKA